MASLFTPPFLDIGAGLQPADGALLNFYVVGSGTRKNTFTTAAATAGTEHANPVVADALGVFPAIYIQGDYDWVLTDKNAVQKNTGSVSEFVTGSGQSENILSRATLNAAVIDTSLQDGLVITVGDRGGSTWDVVLSSTVTENTFYIVQCTGVATLSLVLRIGDVVNVKHFGALGDGVNDDTRLINEALQYGIDNDQAVYIPSSTYILTSLSGFGGIRLFSWTGSSGRFCAFGDGATTVLKMKDGTITNTGQSMIDLRPDADMEHILFKDMVLDMNGQNMPGWPGGSAWEQSHTLRYDGDDAFTTTLLEYDNIVIRNRIGDGMNNQGNGRVKDWKITNCSADRVNLYTRSDIQQSKLVDNLTIVGFTGESIESEPAAFTGTLVSKVTITGCNVARLDLYGAGIADRGLCEYYISNTVVFDQFTAGQSKIAASNCDLKLAPDGRLNYLNDGSSFSNCRILLPYDAGTTTATALNLYASTGNGKFGGNFDNCKILVDTDAAAPITGYLLRSELACNVAEVDNWNWNFKNCEFDERIEYTAYLFRSGTWRFYNCKFGGTVYALHCATSSTRGQRSYIQNADCTAVTGDFIGIAAGAPDQVTTINEVFLSGDFYGDNAAGITTISGTLSTNTVVSSRRNLLLSAIPTSAFKGDLVILPRVDIGEGSEYQATVASISAPNYRLTKQAGTGVGATGSRPTPSTADVGLLYLDTTLDADGHPIWWTGTAWIDAQGAVV
jgi:hypothetical protein